MEDVYKIELEDILHGFQKDKILVLVEWQVEFFLRLYEIIGDNSLRIIEE
jgi:hypothetical protein